MAQLLKQDDDGPVVAGIAQDACVAAVDGADVHTDGFCNTYLSRLEAMIFE